MRRRPVPRSHPRPSWAWSGVVLLSTLLLSPVASANLLSALGRVLPFAAPTASIPHNPSTAPVGPRRASEEEAARVLLHSVLGEKEAETDAEALRGSAAGDARETPEPTPDAPQASANAAPLSFARFRAAFQSPVFSFDRAPSLSVFVGLRASRAPPVG